MLLHGDCLERLKELDSNSVDSMVTDPPAGISFMGKEWDSDKGGREGWITWMQEVMTECLRVLKPGAHGLVWAIPRTSHWTATALENAGFEVRDTILHCFGSGFPKSLNVEKTINKMGLDGTDYAGIGTALKPAVEIWWLIRKPLSEKTIAANVIKHGTGGINIDASRIEAGAEITGRSSKGGNKNKSNALNELKEIQYTGNKQGRFPANLVFSHTEFCTDDICDTECAIKTLDEQSRISKSAGGASRFFYCAKISSSERNAGMGNVTNGHPTVKSKKLMSYLIRMITPPGGTVLDPFMGSGSTVIAAKECGFDFIGIEKEADYFDIASKRIASA